MHSHALGSAYLVNVLVLVDAFVGEGKVELHDRGGLGCGKTPAVFIISNTSAPCGYDKISIYCVLCVI